MAPGGSADFRLGPWQTALADVEAVDHLICDPPFSARTHEGDIAAAGQQMSATGQATRTHMNFACWGEGDVVEFVSWMAPKVRGWWVIFTDHYLFRFWERELAGAGLYTFAPVYYLRHAPRLSGDGPTTAADQIVVARPRAEPWASWGSLPGRYGPFSHDPGQKAGGKPLRLMRAILEDYTDPGDLICDPCAGSGTTLRAAQQLGRRAVGAEVDPETFARAKRRLDAPYEPIRADRRQVLAQDRASRTHSREQAKAQGDLFQI